MEDGTTSVWNLDGAQFYSLFKIKEKFTDCMLAWDLEGAYWAARTLRMEIDAKLKRREENRLLADLEEAKAKRKNTRIITEKENVDSLMQLVDEERSAFISSGGHTNEEAKSRFFKVLEEFYMYLCHIMKKHQMYYREGDDNRLAILRR